MGPAARARNVHGAFALRRGRSVEGKRVVLIDDVLTTGGYRRGVRAGAAPGGSGVGRRAGAGAGAARG